MRILLHDYGGYAFITQLSRELARRGHEISHAFSASVQTPQGLLERLSDDPDTLTFTPIRLTTPINKYSFYRRWMQEREHSSVLLQHAREFMPDVILSADTPSQIQYALSRYCRKSKASLVTWLQDFYGLAASKILARKIPVLGKLVGQYFIALDRTAFTHSAAMISISDELLVEAQRYRAVPSRATVIPNWAPLSEIPVLPKNNAWARQHGLHDKFCFMYTGTLAMKHNPRLLLDLALRFREDDRVRIVVVSEGRSVDWLNCQAADAGLSNLITLPFQPFSELPQVLAAADIQICVLEPEASRFSVPSKVLTYLCAGRSILAAIPSGNLAAKTVLQACAGIVVDPEDNTRFVAAAQALMSSEQQRYEMGLAGRAYAERTFDIAKITDQFEDIITQAAGMPANARANAEASFLP